MTAIGRGAMPSVILNLAAHQRLAFQRGVEGGAHTDGCRFLTAQNGGLTEARRGTVGNQLEPRLVAAARQVRGARSGARGPRKSSKKS
jgi:hypothetical protein